MRSPSDTDMARSFAVAGPWLWNNLPVELRQRDICLREFRRLLKTFLFCWDLAPCDFLFMCAMYKYTYLLTYLSFVSSNAATAHCQRQHKTVTSLCCVLLYNMPRTVACIIALHSSHFTSCMQLTNTNCFSWSIFVVFTIRLGQGLGSCNVSVSTQTHNVSSRSRLGQNAQRLGLVSVSDLCISVLGLKGLAPIPVVSYCHIVIDHGIPTFGGMTKYRVDRADRVDRILPARRPLNYRVDRGTMIMLC